MKNLQLINATLATFPQAAPAYTRAKITVTRAMLVNEAGRDDPFKLFDQPESYTEGGPSSSPATEGWVPSYNPEDYPLSFYVDLGHNYQLDTFYLFDGNGAGSVTVSAGAPGAWAPLFTDNLAEFERWTKWPVAVTTRYFRVTYDQYNDAKGIRELVLYGTRVD